MVKNMKIRVDKVRTVNYTKRTAHQKSAKRTRLEEVILMNLEKQYDAETMQKAEFVAKIFSGLPKEGADRVLELANVYLDGINTGIRLSANIQPAEKA